MMRSENPPGGLIDDERLGANLPEGGLLLLLLTTCCLLLIGCRQTAVSCNDPLGCITIRPNEPIQFAALLPFSGAGDLIGRESLGGLDLAIEARDATLLEHPIRLIELDSACDVETAVSAADELLENEQIVALFGPACSQVVTAVAPVVYDSGSLMITSGATAVTLLPSQLQAASPPALFRTVPDYTEQAQTATQYARTYLNVETAAILHSNSTHSATIMQQFIIEFEKFGGTVLYSEPLPADPAELSFVLEALLATRADLIYLPLNAPEANLVMNKLVELFAPDDLTVFGIDTLFERQFPLQVGSAATGLYVTGTAVQSDAYNLLLGTWRVRYGATPQTYYPAFAYDAFEIVAQAIEETAVVDSRGGLLIGKSALRAAVASTRSYDGLTGRLSCDASGNCFSNQSLDVFRFSEDVIAGNRWPPEAAPRDTLAP